MKNNILKWSLLIISSLFITGCSEFLNEEPLAASSKEDYYRTPYQLQEALNGVYDLLQSNLYNNCEWIFGEACGDDVIGNDESTANQIAELVNFRFNTSNNWILNRYTVNYRGINRANQVIANANKVKLVSTDYGKYTNVREILGQAKFLRAMFYFNLVKTYGGVPIRPETEDINNLVIPRSTKEEVYAYIEKDLREAAIMLSPKYTDDDLGKAGRGSVVGLLMKVLMYQATPGVQSEKWEELVELGDYFVTGKALTLGDILQFEEKYDEDWESLRKRLWFKPAAISAETDPVETPSSPLGDIANQYNVEYIGIYGDALNYWEIFTQKGEFYRGSVFEVMFRESADGTGGDQNEGTGIFQDLYSTRLWISPTFFDVIKNDPRVSQVIVRGGTGTPDGERVNTNDNRYLSLKWYTPKKERPLYSDDYAKNRRFMRYSEVLLMYAEALNECERGADALIQLNKVKSAANKITSSATLYTSGGYGYMRDQIWAERRLELCHEWDRFFDIVRQGRAAKIFHAFASESATMHKRGQYFVEGVNEIFPIPQTEIDLSNGVITQNPGY
ncbi:MAG: SusD family protein [Bacteroidetes bacterium ADurb.Bin174]|nr:MAG: SusD family protein [Bacteroidetes bacterium ADurb.Bin174]